MSRKMISVQAISEVIKDLGDTFTTKDVSEDLRMREVHRQLTRHSHYHAFVGGALSDHRAELDIKEIQKKTSRGSIWQKNRIPHIQTTKYSQTSVNQTFTLVCPSCGGQLQSTIGNSRIKCTHCGNDHIINLKDETHAKQIVTREFQSIQDELLDVKKSVNITNAELAIARINKELSVLRSELKTLEKKRASGEYTPYIITIIGLSSIIGGIIVYFTGCVSVSIINLVFGVPLFFIGIALIRNSNKNFKQLRTRIQSLEDKRKEYHGVLNRGGR
ncbi:MAG: hypothetical protein ACOX7C_09355 [Brevefilum sp.]|jgi:predicted RNA-binding Zn-ribbon protein involved in translation (DUF1610 family)